MDKYNQSTLYICVKSSISKLIKHTKQLMQQSEKIIWTKIDKFERKKQHLWNMEYVFLLLFFFLILQTIVFQGDTYIILWSFSLLAPITHLFNHIHLLNTCLFNFVLSFYTLNLDSNYPTKVQRIHFYSIFFALLFDF